MQSPLVAIFRLRTVELLFIGRISRSYRLITPRSMCFYQAAMRLVVPPYRMRIIHVSRSRKHIVNRNNGFRELVVIFLSFLFNKAHRRSFEPEMVIVENFIICEYEISRGQCEAIMDDDPSVFTRETTTRYIPCPGWMSRNTRVPSPEYVR